MLSSTGPASEAGPSVDVAHRYTDVRRTTERLCEPLEVEDYIVQSMPDASPAKWHLAHTTWFFETFVLVPFLQDYLPFHPDFAYLFNSYYEAVGPRWPRPERGLLTRPTVLEVYRYRAYVDEQMGKLLQSPPHDNAGAIVERVRLGLNHEQQHQELIVTDIKHAWSFNPLHPVYKKAEPADGTGAAPLEWVDFPERVAMIGHEGKGFAFDNETPRHRALVHGFQLATRLVTNGEYLAFIQDAGYDRPELWLSEGWALRQARGWTAPLYWQAEAGQWSAYTMSGLRPLCAAEPVCHVSFFEADAFARWSGNRLPTEQEWETAAAGRPVAGHFLERGRYHPAILPAAEDSGPLPQLYGDVWQWTASPYVGYPGYRPAVGALGEYNGKFMCNQYVLRGASCVTPRSHTRCTYRNFFPPDARWQFTGIRLARDLS
jgi:ergothioneine biosynthesis protein EgtB